MGFLGSAWSKIKGIGGGLLSSGLSGGLAGLLGGLGGGAQKEIQKLSASDRAAIAGSQAGVFAIANQQKLLIAGAVIVAAIILLPRLRK